MILETSGGQAFITRLGEPVRGRRHFGIPPGGPFDWRSAALASQLVGSAEEVYEVALAPATFRVLAFGSVAVTGASGSRVCTVAPGDVVEIAPAILGARSYVAASSVAVEPRTVDAPLPQRGTLRVMATCEEPATALDAAWTVTVQLDRQGIRLNSVFTGSAQTRTSEATVPGAIQITPDGTAIILGPDGPTIGGYATVGVVIDADFDLAGQLRPGEAVLFERVTLAEALAARRA